MKQLNSGINEPEGNIYWDLFVNACELSLIVGFWGGLILLFVVL